MKYPLILIFLICGYITKAQNLVPDSSFEDYVNCPTTFGQIICPLTPTPPFPQTLKHWISPCFNSPDYFNGCSTDPYSTVPNNFYGYKPAKTSNGYVGIVAYSGYIANPSGSYREYVETELKSPLKAAKKYQVSFYVNNCAISNAGTNVVAVKTIGVAFSPTQVTSPSWPLSLSHVDAGTVSGSYLDNATGWTKVSCEYMATGGEKYLVIGCFNTGAVPDIKQITPPTQNPSDPIFSYYYIYQRN